MQSIQVMRALLGTILMCSATALAAPGDAPPPAPVGPSGSAQPVDPYQRGPVTTPDTSAPPDASPAAPAPSQQQPPANAPQPDTERTPADHPQPPASEQKPNPEIDKPAPAPVDTPVPPVKDKQSSRDMSGSAAKTDAPSNAPGNVEPNVSNAPGNVEAKVSSSTESNAPGNVEPAPVVEQLGPVVDVENAPPECRDAGKLAQSRDRGVVLSAKISFALCTANAALTPLQLVDAEASVNEVDRATSNSLALLAEVANAGDPKWAIVALHAAGDLLATMTKRMTDTVPANSPAELRDMRTQMLQPHLQPWIERSQKAFSEVDRLAKANPQLAKNQVVANSRKRVGTGVATR
jgi:hypothetical protein